MTTSHHRILAAVGLATALGLSGCGGDPAPSADPAPEPSPTTAPSPEPCPITAVEVPSPAGAVTDLATKPVVSAAMAAPPTELQYSDLVVGTGDEAVNGSQVEVKYVGALYETGAEFDSSWSRGVDETIPFGICQSGVIPGFAVGPTGMKVGGRRQITIPSPLAYRAEGRPPTIPGGATLVFVVDLVEVD